jgi:3-oxoacyl-[acyl-carrier protein] reductase
MTDTLTNQKAQIIMNKALTGKITLITGGTRGIGKAIAERFAEQGATVIITGRSEFNQTADIINKNLDPKNGDGCVEYMQCSLTEDGKVNTGAIQQLIENILKKYERVDVLVNNAGITRDMLFVRMKEEDWHEVINTNLNALFYLTQPVVKAMSKQKSGCIINMSSVVGLHGNPAQVNYSTTKAGLIGFTKSLAKEYGRRGIRVNVIAPGFIRTEMTDQLPLESQNKYKENIPLGEFGEAKDIADTALFLAGSGAYITGQVLQVDGGLFM